jgi:hypothetical protein
VQKKSGMNGIQQSLSCALAGSVGLKSGDDLVEVFREFVSGFSILKQAQGFFR